MSSTLLRDVRRRAALTQTDLAHRAGTSQATISAYESGAKTPRLSTAERLVEAAGQTLVARPKGTWRTVVVRRELDTFSRLSIKTQSGDLEVDLAIDAPLVLEETESPLGPTPDISELAAMKQSSERRHRDQLRMPKKST